MSASLLTPQMAGVLEQVRRANQRPFYAMSVADARRAYVDRTEVLELPRARLARIEDLEVPGADGHRLRARLVSARPREPDGPLQPVVLYLHGGGFTIGEVATHDSLCRQLAERSGAAVLAVEYRLAPEHRFPAAVDDTWAVMAWLAAAQDGVEPPAASGWAPSAASLGLDGRRLAVAGDSAGGTLSAVAAIHARDRALRIALQVLITPGTAARPDFASYRLFATGFLLEAAGIDWFFDHYIDRHDRHDWRFAPLEAPDLDGLAPALVVLAECDPLVDEGVAYADRLRAAGVEVELDLVRGVTHDFIKMGRAIPQALDAQALIAGRLRERLFA
jgi:acetyl esterase